MDEQEYHQPAKTDCQSVRACEAEPSQLPEHLIKMVDPQWVWWRWASLRGAGFTAIHVLRLASPECAAEADRLIRAQDEARLARSQAIDVIEHALEQADAAKQGGLERARRRLQKNKLPESLDFACAAKTAIDVFRAACAGLDVIRKDYVRQFNMASRRVSDAIREVADTPGFLEAITWQNRRALQTAIRPLLRNYDDNRPRCSKERQSEELIARYLQRYCTKNETIGFFGPVGWARLNSHGAALIARPGLNLLSSRQVYFESWCIDEIARALAKNRAVLNWVAPRLMPFVRITGLKLYLPSGEHVYLPQAEADVLQACSSGQTAKEIALAAIRRHPHRLRSELQVYNLLESFSRRGLIWWDLEAPPGAHPEVELRRLLEPIEDENLRGMALNALTELEDAKRAIADAAGDAEKLDHAFRKLEDTFTQITGKLRLDPPLKEER